MGGPWGSGLEVPLSLEATVAKRVSGFCTHTVARLLLLNPN